MRAGCCGRVTRGLARRRLRAHRVPDLQHGRHSFRYLAAGDYWFNEDMADGQDGPNSRIHT